MGVLYTVIPAGEIDQHPFEAECLQYYGISRPSLTQPSRNPTPKELHTILDGLPGYKTDYLVSSNNWQATVKATKGLPFFRSSTLVNLVDFQGDETIPHLFYFEAGQSELNIRIVERLSRLCGPFFVFPDIGAPPVLVIPGIDPVQAVQVWEDDKS